MGTENNPLPRDGRRLTFAEAMEATMRMRMRVMSGAAVVIMAVVLTAARGAAVDGDAKTLPLAEIVRIVESVAGSAKVRGEATSMPEIVARTGGVEWVGQYRPCAEDNEPDCVGYLAMRARFSKAKARTLDAMDFWNSVRSDGARALVDDDGNPWLYHDVILDGASPDYMRTVLKHWISELTHFREIVGG